MRTDQWLTRGREVISRRVLRGIAQFGIGLGLLLSLVLPSSSALAASGADQVNLPSTNFPGMLIPNDVLTQTFTPSRSGNLLGVWLAAACDSNCATFTISLLGVTVPAGSATGGAVVPVTTWAGGNSGNLQFIQFTSAIPVSAGQTYRIELSACNCGLQLLATGDQYLGGQLLNTLTGAPVSPPTDLVFVTQMADTTPPSVKLGQTPTNPSSSTTATFQFNATDSDDASGFTFACALDGAAFTNCTNGDPNSMIQYSNLALGQHTFAVHATDSSSNTGPDTTFTWRVGLPQPPTTTARVTPLPTSAGWNNSDVSVTLSASPASGTQLGNTYYAVDTPTCTPAALGSCSVYSGPIAITAQGTHSLTFFSANTMGDLEATNTLPVKLDKTPPTISFGAPSPAPNAAGWNTTDVSISFSASDSDSGVQDSTPNSSPLMVTGEGTGLQVPAQATNYAGLSTGVLSPPVNIDRTPPTTAAQLSPTLNPQGWANRAVTVTLSATDALSGVDHIEASLDGGAWATVSGPISVSADGVHMLQYRSVDRAGNVEATQTATLRIDQTPPVLTITPTPGSLPSGQPLATVLATASFSETGGQPVGTTTVTCFNTRGLSLGLSATDPAGGAGVASLNYGASGAQPIPSTTTSATSVTLPISATGPTVISATATDQAGNGSTAQQETVLVDSARSLPLACAAQTTGFAVPPHGSVRLAGMLSINGLSIPLNRTIRY